MVRTLFRSVFLSCGEAVPEVCPSLLSRNAFRLVANKATPVHFPSSSTQIRRLKRTLYPNVLVTFSTSGGFSGKLNLWQSLQCAKPVCQDFSCGCASQYHSKWICSLTRTLFEWLENVSFERALGTKFALVTLIPAKWNTTLAIQKLACPSSLLHTAAFSDSGASGAAFNWSRCVDMSSFHVVLRMLNSSCSLLKTGSARNTSSAEMNAWASAMVHVPLRRLLNWLLLTHFRHLLMACTLPVFS